MRYICSICGYVYDEEKEGVPFSGLPDTWVCPLCRAAKSLFAPERQPETASAPVTPALSRETNVPDEAPELLSPWSSPPCAPTWPEAARSSTRRRKRPYFRRLPTISRRRLPPPRMTAAAWQACSRMIWTGGIRLSTAPPESWATAAPRESASGGEKVTMILNSLAQRYRAEGPSFLKYTQIWVCSVCGFVFVGNEPPELCPVCKVPAWKFDKIEGRASK